MRATGGAAQTIACHSLVGADGVRSTVQVNGDSPSLIGQMDCGDTWFFMPTGVPDGFKVTDAAAAALIRKATGIDLPYDIISTDEWVASRADCRPLNSRKPRLKATSRGRAQIKRYRRCGAIFRRRQQFINLRVVAVML